jgi:hypothetical protein
MCLTLRHDFGLKKYGGSVENPFKSSMTDAERKAHWDNMETIYEKFIKQLLPPERINVYVVCKDYAEFKSIIGTLDIYDGQEARYHFVSNVDQLRGMSNPIVLFRGNWIDHPMIIEIITQVKIAKRDYHGV